VPLGSLVKDLKRETIDNFYVDKVVFLFIYILMY